MTPYIVLAILLPILLWAYIPFARRIGMCAQSNGSGNEKVAVGGGVIFYIGAMIPLLFSENEFNISIWLLMAGGAILGVLSFADDMVKLPPQFRLVVQLLVISTVLYEIFEAGHYDIYLISIIACVGFANASNFMDGINGMLALYGIVVLSTLIAVPYVMEPVVCPLFPTTNITHYLTGLLIALTVFALFNVRHRSLVFAGDVGSVTLGYFAGITIIWLSIIYNTLSMMSLVIVYLIDTFCTFLQRLFNGERVMEPHRKHLYQQLVAQGYSPLRISASYAAIQLCVNIGWLAVPADMQLLYTIIITLALLTAYISLKIRLLGKTSK